MLVAVLVSGPTSQTKRWLEQNGPNALPQNGSDVRGVALPGIAKQDVNLTPLRCGRSTRLTHHHVLGNTDEEPRGDSVRQGLEAASL